MQTKRLSSCQAFIVGCFIALINASPCPADSLLQDEQTINPRLGHVSDRLRAVSSRQDEQTVNPSHHQGRVRGKSHGGQCIDHASMHSFDPTTDESAKNAYIEASHKFTLTAFQAIHKKLSSGSSPPGNLIFSPYSIWQAVVLTYLVSGGKMKDDIETSLGLEGFGKDAVYHVFKSLQTSIGNQQPSLPAAPQDFGYRGNYPGSFNKNKRPEVLDESMILESANRIFVDSSLQSTLNEETSRLLQNEIQNSDFSRRPARARQEINDWIANMTRGRIDNMFSSDDINSGTAMVLANAAYFRGTWDRKFLESMTSSKCFFLDPARKEAVVVPMMRNIGLTLDVYFSNELRSTIVKIPYYQGEESPELGRINMYLMVPEESPDWSVDDVIKQLTPDRTDALREALRGGKPHTVMQFSLPKFKFMTKLNLEEVLSELGLGSAFSNAANFECLSDRLKGVRMTAKHQAVIDVNEKGTEAAAATGSLVPKSGSFLPTVTHLNVDRPFLYAILGSRMHEVLFMGVARNPLNTN